MIAPSRTPYYPLEVQASLIEQALNGNHDRVSATLNDIRERNLVSRTLRHDDLRQLLYEMRGTIQRLAEKSRLELDFDPASLQGVYSEFEVDRDAGRVFDALAQLYQRYCEVAEQQNADRTTRFRQRLVDFVHDNVGDPNLGLKMVAVELGLSEKYLSALFKDQTGENFGAYVENRRMERAAQLLEDSRVQMKDVAQLSGYQNANTCYKAFKRRFEVSPGRYRLTRSRLDGSHDHNQPQHPLSRDRYEPSRHG